MNAFDHRRVIVACVLTLVALPALWVLNRESASSSGSPNLACVNCPPASGGLSNAPPTTAYVPQPPLFVGGRQDSTPPVLVHVAVPPTPNANEHLVKASFARYVDGSTHPCTTLLAPEHTVLKVLNVDNGQSVTCTNVLGMNIPAGADIVLHTDDFATISDLSDAPIVVRVSW
jgi:hypothetical protein